MVTLGTGSLTHRIRRLCCLLALEPSQSQMYSLVEASTFLIYKMDKKFISLNAR